MHIVYSEHHKLHATDAVWWDGAPFVTEEVPARAEIILSAIQAANLGKIIEPVDHGIEPILAVHDKGYVNYLSTAYDENAAFFGQAEPVFPHVFPVRQRGVKPKSFPGLRGYYAFATGTPILKGTWQAAYWSAQSALTAADCVYKNEKAAYALCRPPGHHAAEDLYGGSCFLNNAAIAARYLHESGVHIAILDIDYHHGNGTQSIFYRDPDVLFCSLHAYPDDEFPFFWGYPDEGGEGPGEGSNYNWPLPQTTDDTSYLDALHQALEIIKDFSPRYLIVSVGFDFIKGDPIGCFNVTSQGLSEIGKQIADLGLPTVITQEGGYLMEELGDLATTFLNAFV
jgi:acetoin utilization deacetylase AcuC-like enzyme